MEKDKFSQEEGKKLQKAFDELAREHTRLNKALSSYRTIPQIQYFLTSAAWASFTASCPTHGDCRLPYTNGVGQKLFIQEGTAISLLVRLAEAGNLWRIRLCSWCKKRWLASFRRVDVDKFCSDACRVASYFSTEKGKEAHNKAQKAYRERQKREARAERKTLGKKIKFSQQILRSLGRKEGNEL